MDMDISFQKSIRELTELIAKLETMGAAADAAEGKGNKLGGRFATSLKELEKTVQQTTEALLKRTAAQHADSDEMEHAEAMAANLARVQQKALSVLQRLSQQNVEASVKVAALKGELGGLQNVLQETSAMKAWIKLEERRASLLTENTHRTKLLSDQLFLTHTNEAKQNAVLEQQIRTQTQLASAEAKVSGQRLISARQAELAATDAGKEVAVNAERTRGIREMAAMEEKRVNALARLHERNEYLASDAAKDEALLKANIRARQEEVNSYAQTELAQQRAAAGYERLTKEAAALIGRQRELESSARAADEALIRASRISYRQASTNAGYSQAVGRAARAATGDAGNNQVASRLAAVTSYGRDQTATLRLVTQEEAALVAEEKRLQSAISGRNKAMLEAAESQSRLSTAQAESRAQVEALRAAQERDNKATLDAARAKHGLSEAQLEVQRTQEQHVRTLNRLKAESDFLNTAEGRRTATLRAQIAEEQRRVRSMSRTIPEILGMKSSLSDLSNQMTLANQASAAYRASLAGFHATFGMYTSATILAASSAYAFASTLRDTISSGMQYQQTLSRIQAITSTVGETSETAANRMKIVDLATRSAAISSIYNAQQTAEGFQYLAMSGMSAAQSVLALPSALQLASVASISMKESADLATNILSTFGLKAKDLTEVVDVMAKAVTSSNTTMMEMANAISYVGPSAAAAGFQLKDLAASVAVLANNGIKGSRAGTGLRGIITALADPSSKATGVFLKLGISMTDMEGKTRSLSDIMGQFKKAMAGMNDAEKLATVSQAFGRYAQAAATSLIQNSSSVAQFRQQLEDARGSAAVMADTIRNNLAGTWENTTSTFSDLKLDVFKELEPLLRTLAMEATAFMSSIQPEQIETAVAKVYDLSQSLFTLAKIWTGFKVASMGAQVFGGMANSLNTASTLIPKVTQGVRDYARSVLVVKTATDAATASQNANTASATAQATALTRVASATRIAASGAALLQGALGGIGTVMALGGAAYALYETYFSNGQEDVKNYNSLIDQSIEKQKQLTKTIEEAEKARQQKQYQSTAEAAQHDVGRYESALANIDEFSQKFGMNDSLQALKENTQRALSDSQEVLTNAKNTLNEFGKSGDAASVATSDLTSKLQEAHDLTARINKLSSDQPSLYVQSAAAIQGNTAVVAQLQYKLEQVEAAIRSMNHELQNSSVSLMTWGSTIEEARAKAQADSVRRAQSPTQRRNDVQKEIDTLTEITKKSTPGTTHQEQYTENVTKLYKELSQLDTQIKNDTDALNLSKRNLARARAGGDQKFLKQDLASNQYKINELEKDSINNQGELTKLYSEQTRITSALMSSQKKAATAQKREDREHQREIEKASRTYLSMLDGMDGGAMKASRVFHDRAEAINKLFKQGTLANVAAMANARLMYDREMEKEQRYYKAPGKLRDEYTPTNDFVQRAYDVRAIRANRLPDMPGNENRRALSLQQEENARAAARKDTLSGLTQADKPDSGLGAYGGIVSAQLNQDKISADYGTRQAQLAKYYADEVSSQDAHLEEMRAGLGEHSADYLAIQENMLQKRAALESAYGSQSAQLEQSRLEQMRQANLNMQSSMAGGMSSTLESMAQFADEGSSIHQTIMVASKAFQVAQTMLAAEASATQIIAYGEVAAFQAQTLGPAGAGIATAIRADAQRSAFMVRGLAVANAAISVASGLAQAGKSSGSSSRGSSSEQNQVTNNVTFSGFHDNGGSIGAGQYGIAGERGPEIVMGPATVISREQTAAAARRAVGGGGGEGEVHLHFNPEIHVNGGSGNAEETAALVTAQVRQLFNSEFADRFISEAVRQKQRGGVFNE